MPAAPSAAELYEIARGALPRFLFEIPRSRETLWGAAMMFARVGAFVDERVLQTLIKNASAPWLGQHARDRGTYVQVDEIEEATRTRLRTLGDVATVPALLAAINAILAPYEVGDAAITELGTDGSFAGQAYAGQGFRVGCIKPLRIIVILPYNTPTTIVGAIGERLRKIHAAGILVNIEVRQIP